MKIEVVSTKQAFFSLADQWNSLLKKSSTDQVYLTHEWFHCWWNAFGNDKRPLILIIKEKDQVIGIAPLLVTTVNYRNVFKIKEVDFWVNEVSPRIDFICHSGDERMVIEAIIEYLLKNTQIWDVFKFAKIPENSIMLDILRKILSDRQVTFKIDKSVQSPFLNINTDWETYYASRTPKFRKGLRNKINRIQKQGACQIEKICDPEKLIEMLPVIYDISSRSWKQHVNTSFSTDKKQTLFYRELTEIGGDQGWINIWLLKYSGEYIAFEYHLVYGETIHVLRGDYDEAFKTISPGSCLEYYIIKHHFDEAKAIEYDFCGDNYQYMLNWTDNVRGHINMRIFNKNIVSRTVATADCMLIPYLRNINKRFNFLTKGLSIY
jgi:CelD/BcsL family acetyltransferase involved in cellulose biosynthesis